MAWCSGCQQPTYPCPTISMEHLPHGKDKEPTKVESVRALEDADEVAECYSWKGAWRPF